MSDPAVSEPAAALGCLLCLVQASESMRDEIFEGEVSTKIEAALETVDRLVNELIAVGAGPFELAILAYRGGDEGALRVWTICPGSSAEEPFVSATAIGEPSPESVHESNGRLSVDVPSGDSPGCAALAYAGQLARLWAEDHLIAPSPIILHLTDGESCDGPLDDVARVLMGGRRAPFLVHCLFRQRLSAPAFTRIPETPSGDLWSMSSPLPDQPGDDPDSFRALLVNKRAAFHRISELVRRIWNGAGSPPESDSDVPFHASALAVDPPPSAAEPREIPEPVSEPVPEPPVPEGTPRFEARVLWTAKRGNTEPQWEDGYALNPPAGVIAVADGAGDGIFSKLWADILLDSYLAHPVALDDSTAVAAWINSSRSVWAKKVDYPRQRWSVQLRLDQTCGAATFLGLEIGESQDEAAGNIPWTAAAVGDVCLFQIREGSLIDSFPIARSADFGTTPTLFQSKPMRPMPIGIVRRGNLLPGDRLVIATDALAQSLLARVEAGTPPDWNGLWDLERDAFVCEVESLRDQGAIVNDDCTLVVVRLPGDASSPTSALIATEPEPVAAAGHSLGEASPVTVTETLENNSVVASMNTLEVTDETAAPLPEPELEPEPVPTEDGTAALDGKAGEPS